MVLVEHLLQFAFTERVLFFAISEISLEVLVLLQELLYLLVHEREHLLVLGQQCGTVKLVGHKLKGHVLLLVEVLQLRLLLVEVSLVVNEF